MRTKSAPQAPTFTVIAPTAHYRIDRVTGWVYCETWVRMADGSVELWDLPEYPIGSAL